MFQRTKAKPNKMVILGGLVLFFYLLIPLSFTLAEEGPFSEDPFSEYYPYLPEITDTDNQSEAIVTDNQSEPAPVDQLFEPSTLESLPGLVAPALEAYYLRLDSDITPPTGSIRINNDSQYANSTIVTLNLSSQDNPGGSGLSQMQFFDEDDYFTWSDPEPYSQAKSWKLSPSNGIKTLSVRYQDLSGNWSSAVSDSIILDSRAPAGSIKINNDAAAANSTQVVLTLTSQDAISGVIRMQLSNNNIAWADSEAYAPTKDWRITPGNGEKTVFARYQDKAGNWSVVYSDTIELKIPVVDETPPVTTVLGIDDSWHNAPVTITLSASEPGSVSYYSYRGEDPQTLYTGPFTISEEGIFILKYYSKDKAGNVEVVKTASSQIKIDKAPPKIIINPVDSPTNQNVTLSYSVTDNFTPRDEIIITGDNSPYTNEGTYNVILTAKDKAGNTSDSSINFIIKRYTPSPIPPTPPPVVIPPPPPSAPPPPPPPVDNAPPTTTDSGIDGKWYKDPVTVTLNATDRGSGIDKTYYSLDGLTPTALYSAPFTVSSEGAFSLKYYSKDKTGNSESIKTATNQIKIDKTPPAGSIKINNGAAATTSTSVTLTLSSQDDLSGILKMQFSNDGVTYYAEESYVASRSWVLISGDGAKSVYVKFKDRAGNWSAAYSSNISLKVPVVDTTPPVTTDSGIDGLWHKEGVTVTLSANDTDSGIEKTYYSLDGTIPSILYTSPFTVSEEGEFTLKYYSQDKLGNKETVKTANNKIKIEKSAPVTTDSGIDGLWHNSTVTVTLTAADTGSGVDKIYYSLDGTEPKTLYSGPFTVSEEGEFTLKYYSQDKLGNKETVKTANNKIRIEKAAPLTTDSGIDGLWHKEGITVTLSANDTGSGVEKTYYSLDGSEPKTLYSGPFTVSEEGEFTLKYYSQDKLGNKETVKTANNKIRIEKGAPVTTDSGIDGLWHNSAVTVSLTATDTGSGVEKTYYSLDGTTPATLYTAPFTVSEEGEFTLKYYSQDKLGNKETVKAANNKIKIEKTAPFTTDSGIDSLWHNSSVTVILTATDTGSGLEKTYYSLDGTTPSILYSTPFTVSEEGEFTLKYYSQDKLGHKETVKTAAQQIRIEKAAPLTTDSGIDGLWHNSSVTVTLTATDSGSGVEKTYYSLDGSEPKTLYTAPFTVSEEGEFTLKYYSQDKAGNTETVKTASNQIKIDKTQPVIIITSPEDGAVFDTEQVLLEGTIDGVTFQEGHRLTQEGENILTKTVFDAAGNSSSASVTVYLYSGEPVGPDGGTVTSLDGKIKVIIPAGALSETKKIKILPIDKETFQDTAPNGKSLLSLVECRPYGLVFNKPVSLIYTLSLAEVPGTSVELGLYDSIQDKITSTGQVSVVPPDGYTLNFSLLHFSTYAALKGMVSSGAPIGGGVKIPLPDMFTGSFSSSIPITVPPGRKGLQPALGLVYRSSNANSWVGLGFSLNPGYIVRSTKLGPPTYIDTQDTFYFVSDAGTSELVWLIDNLYQAKIESSFTKFFKEADDSWRVVAKDGSTLRFGQAPDSKEGSNLGTFSWYLTKAVDTNGNYIQYQYLKDEGKAYLSRIDYTGNEAGLSPTNTVEFSLEARDDVSSSYITSAKIATARRLKEIQAKVNGDLVWRYELEYSYSPDTNRSLLKSVKQYASDNKSLPAQKLSYQKAK